MTRLPLPFRAIHEGVSERPDGQHMAWVFDYLFDDDLVPRWIPVEVCESREQAKRVAYRHREQAWVRSEKYREAA